MRCRTPREIIDAYTTSYIIFSTLDEDGLGRELYRLVATPPDNIDLVHEVLDALDGSDSGQVALGFVSPLTDTQIRSIALSDRGRMLLLRLLDEMSSGTQATHLLEIFGGIERDEAEAVEPVADLPRKTMQLKIVKYRYCTLNLEEFQRRTESIFRDQCGIDITYRITNANSDQTERDLRGDAVIDLTPRGNDVEGNNVKQRVRYGGTNYVVPIAFVQDIRVSGAQGQYEGFTPRGGPCAVSNLAGTRFETLAHEICVFYGMPDIRQSRRLRHGEGPSRTGELLLPYECSDFRRRL